MPLGGALLMSVCPGVLLFRCVGGLPPLAFILSVDTQDTCSHFPFSLVLSPQPHAPLNHNGTYAQWSYRYVH